ncbi:hypothetical protein MTO96_044748 [Rhipicephalus appendiculatus]
MSEMQKLPQDFCQEVEAILASYRKPAAREQQQKLAKEATDKAVRHFQLQQQEQPVVASKKKKAKANAAKEKQKPLSAF